MNTNPSQPYKQVRAQSGTPANSCADIAFYSITEQPYGDIVLLPGFGQSSRTSYLMTRILNWAVPRAYRVITVDTFLGNIQPLTPEQVQQYTYPELQTLIEESLGEIQSHDLTTPHIVAHSTTTTVLTDIFNKSVKNNQSLPAQSAVMFAPFPHNLSIFARLAEKTADENQRNFLYSMESFSKELLNVPFDPQTMLKWNIPVCFVVGKKDKIASPENAKSHISQLSTNPFIWTKQLQSNHNFANLPLYDIKKYIAFIVQQNSKTKAR